MTAIAVTNGQVVMRGDKVGTEDGCCPVPGCTNPYSPNYDPNATCDDGSCLTCCNQGKCVLDDPDCGAQCSSLTAENGCNPAGTTEQDPEGCVDCCDSFCQDGCPDNDPPLSAPQDCSPTFANSFTVTACNSCGGQEFVYHNCYDCDYSPPP